MTFKVRPSNEMIPIILDAIKEDQMECDIEWLQEKLKKDADEIERLREQLSRAQSCIKEMIENSRGDGYCTTLGLVNEDQDD